MTVQKESFGRTPAGEEAMRFLLENAKGLRIALINWGATIQSVTLPLATGAREITHGFDDLSGYVGSHPFFGATIGRVANRIAGAEFKLAGGKYKLSANDGNNSLHGGTFGFSRQVWAAEVLGSGAEASVRFSLESEAGDEGYPGNLTASVTITLTEEDELRFDYYAVTDAATPVNLTNHAYWNLAGETAHDVLDHIVRLDADHYLPVNKELIPTGEVMSVANSGFDFRKPSRVGAGVDAVPGGIDNCYVVRDAVTLETGGSKPQVSAREAQLRPVAEVSLPNEEIRMSVESTLPGVQFYTGNMLKGQSARGGRTLDIHAALCLETQHFPDAVNQSHFPSCTLKPGEEFAHSTIHRFSYPS